MMLRKGSLLLILFCLCGAIRAEATPSNSYEQIADELSRTMKLYQDLNQRGEGYDVVFRRDPMRALIDTEGRFVGAEGLYNGLAVQGIIHSKDMALVLVNDEFFHQGDQVGPYKILEIRPDGLVARQGNNTFFVPLYPESKSGMEEKPSPL